MKLFRFTLLLALLTAFPPLATDMYLPAIPSLQSLWHVPLALINLTLVIFFVVYCISLLIYGPLSDRFGRRPPLMAGIFIFIAGSALCGVSTSVEMLVAARMIQAFGAASASAISIAMTKDRLQGKERERVMGYVAVIMSLAPMISPMVGSLILEYASWHYIFAVQGGLGILAFIGVYFTPESHLTPTRVSVKELAASYFLALKNKKFMAVVVCTSLVGLPSFGFIAASSSIYITQCHLSESAFSLFFAGNALGFMAGAMACTRFGKQFSSSSLISAGLAGVALGGIVMVFNPFSGPWALALPMAFISFSLGGQSPSGQ